MNVCFFALSGHEDRSRMSAFGVKAVLRTAEAIGLTTAMPREARRPFIHGFSLPLLMANDVAPVVDFNHGNFVFLIHHRDGYW